MLSRSAEQVRVRRRCTKRAERGGDPHGYELLFLNLHSNQMAAEGKFFSKQTALDIFTGNKERVCKRILLALFISEM